MVGWSRVACLPVYLCTCVPVYVSPCLPASLVEKERGLGVVADALVLDAVLNPLLEVGFLVRDGFAAGKLVEGVVEVQGARRSGEAGDARWKHDVLSREFKNGLDLETGEDDQNGEVGVDAPERVDQGLAGAVERGARFISVYDLVQCLDMLGQFARRFDQQIKSSIGQPHLHGHVLRRVQRLVSVNPDDLQSLDLAEVFHQRLCAHAPNHVIPGLQVHVRIVGLDHLRDDVRELHLLQGGDAVGAVQYHVAPRIVIERHDDGRVA